MYRSGVVCESQLLNTIDWSAKGDSKQEQADKLVTWFRNLSQARQRSIEEKAVAFCQQQHASIYDGYLRNRDGGGDAFERYREMLVKTFSASRTKSKAA